MKRVMFFITIGIMLTLTLVGCGKTQQSAPKQTWPLTITSGNHNTTLAKVPERVVALSATATETVFAIGAGQHVVAADAFSTYPAEAPDTGMNATQPDAKTVLGFQPELVIISADANKLLEAMNKANVPVLIQPRADTVSDIYTQISDLGKVFDRSANAAKVIKETKGKIDNATRRVPKTGEVASYYIELSPDFSTATSRSYLGEILGKFGLRNIADARGTEDNAFPKLSSEYIVAANPNFIFLADVGNPSQSIDAVRARPSWASIAAIKSNHVTPLDDNIALTWGPRIGNLADAVATALTSR